MLIPLIYLNTILHYSKTSSPILAITFCDGNSYYCPPMNLCYRRYVRCTPAEPCDYTGYESDNCFRSETSSGAYKVFLGHVKLLSSLPLPAPFQPEHQVIQYRGLTYEFGYNGIFVHDVNDPMYHYRENNSAWRYARRGLENVGISYCDFADINYIFLKHWNFSYKSLRKNCIHFAEALTLFLTTGPCQASIYIDKIYKPYSTMNEHGQSIVDNVPKTCKIFGRKRLWSSFLYQSIITERIIITTFSIQYGILYILQ